jgi:hypothetical protein
MQIGGESVRLQRLRRHDRECYLLSRKHLQEQLHLPNDALLVAFELHRRRLSGLEFSAGNSALPDD